MCDILICSPEDLFSEVQLTTALESNRRTIEVNEAEMRFMIESRPEVLSIETQVHKDRTAGAISELLNTLTPREAKVISMRFGLGEYSHCHLLQEVADAFDVSRERIRHIEAKALRKLRHPRHAEIIQDYR